MNNIEVVATKKVCCSLIIWSRDHDFTYIRMSLPRQNDIMATTYYHVPTNVYVVATTKLNKPNMSLTVIISFLVQSLYLLFRNIDSLNNYEKYCSQTSTRDLERPCPYSASFESMEAISCRRWLFLTTAGSVWFVHALMYTLADRH